MSITSMVKDEFDRLNTRIAQLERELDDASNELMTMQSKPEYQYAFDNGVRSVEWMVKHAQELRNSIADTDPNIMSDRELVEQPGKLKAQLDEYKKKAELYEIVRRMNPIAFKAAFQYNISTGKPFDEIISELKPFYFPG